MKADLIKVITNKRFDKESDKQKVNGLKLLGQYKHILLDKMMILYPEHIISNVIIVIILLIMLTSRQKKKMKSEKLAGHPMSLDSNLCIHSVIFSPFFTTYFNFWSSFKNPTVTPYHYKKQKYKKNLTIVFNCCLHSFSVFVISTVHEI